MRQTRNWIKLWMLAVVLSMTLIACAPIQITGITDNSCRAFEPISFDGEEDTPDTIKEIREHNAAWRAICGE